MKHCKRIITKYRHAIPLIVYGIIYWVWFWYLENTNTRPYHIVHLSVDDYIPFCEYFVIPYFLWFVYVSSVVLFQLFKDKEEYYNTCAFLFTGMTVFLIVSTLWPNVHHLRPGVIPRTNVFTGMVRQLWKTDTPTNLWPSIHVYNSLGAHFAVMHSKKLRSNPLIFIGSAVLAASIVLSTLFIKQHSVFDVLTAFGMTTIMYIVVYKYRLASFVRDLFKRLTAKKYASN